MSSSDDSDVDPRLLEAVAPDHSRAFQESKAAEERKQQKEEDDRQEKAEDASSNRYDASTWREDVKKKEKRERAKRQNQDLPSRRHNDAESFHSGYESVTKEFQQFMAKRLTQDLDKLLSALPESEAVKKKKKKKKEKSPPKGILVFSDSTEPLEEFKEETVSKGKDKRKRPDLLEHRKKKVKLDMAETLNRDETVKVSKKKKKKRRSEAEEEEDVVKETTKLEEEDAKAKRKKKKKKPRSPPPDATSSSDDDETAAFREAAVSGEMVLKQKLA